MSDDSVCVSFLLLARARALCTLSVLYSHLHVSGTTGHPLAAEAFQRTLPEHLSFAKELGFAFEQALDAEHATNFIVDLVFKMDELSRLLDTAAADSASLRRTCASSKVTGTAVTNYCHRTDMHSEQLKEVWVDTISSRAFSPLLFAWLHKFICRMQVAPTQPMVQTTNPTSVSKFYWLQQLQILKTQAKLLGLASDSVESSENGCLPAWPLEHDYNTSKSANLLNLVDDVIIYIYLRDKYESIAASRPLVLSFQREVSRDIASAVGIPLDRLLVTNTCRSDTNPPGVLVVFEILADTFGPTPQDIAQRIISQASVMRSPLRKGVHTRNLFGIWKGLPAQSSEAKGACQHTLIKGMPSTPDIHTGKGWSSFVNSTDVVCVCE